MRVVEYRKRGLFVFAIGILLGMLFTASMLWADLEASLFDTAMPAEQRLTALSCPVAITTNETGTIKATFSNPHDRPVTRTVRGHISKGYLTYMRNDDIRLTLQPGESQTLEWPVTGEDAVWNRVVLVRVYAIRSAPLPSTTGTCGVLVVGIPFATGNQVVLVSISIILLTQVLGLVLFVKDNGLQNQRLAYASRAMAAMAVTVGASMFAGLSGTWMLAGLLWLFAILLIITIVAYFMLSNL